MSVVFSKRSEGSLQVLNLANRLCVYSVTKASNEKFFPKSKRWLFAQPISNKALQILACVRSANSIFPKCKDDYLARRKKQIEAHTLLNELISLIDMAEALGYLNSKTVCYWIEIIVNTDKKLMNWANADWNNYNNLE